MFQKLEMGAERSECLDLKGEVLLTESCEPLEEILKRIQFVKINLEATSLNDEVTQFLHKHFSLLNTTTGNNW
jgi:hypothetical protein